MRLILLALLVLTPGVAWAQENVSFERTIPNQFHVRVGDKNFMNNKPFAVYVTKHEKIQRPFFTHLHDPTGLLLTRNFPPQPGKDDVDHDTYHPGLWMSFGDLGGEDFWRNKGSVEHVDIVARDANSFTVKNRYLSGKNPICEEVCRFLIKVKPTSYLLLWDSRFSNDKEFWFGDQEEMGLGVRVATPLAVKKGGKIVNSDGKINEKQAWGKTAEWAVYKGQLDGKSAGVLVMPHPENFRKSWFHARDYGLLVANPFGRNAFTKEAPSKVVVKAGETMRLRFAVLFFTGNIDEAAEYRDTLKFWK